MNRSITDDLIRYEALKWLLKRSARWMRRSKTTLRIILVAVLPLVVGGFLHVKAPQQTIVTELITLALLLHVAVWGKYVGAPLSLLVPPNLDKGSDRKLGGTGERLYVIFVLWVVGCAIAIVQLKGLQLSFLAVYASIAFVIGSMWALKAIGGGGRFARQWAQVAEQIPEFRNSQVIGMQSIYSGTQLTVRLRPGQTPDSVYGTEKGLISFYRLKPGSLFIDASTTIGSDINIIIRDDHYKKEPIKHPLLLNPERDPEWPVDIGRSDRGELCKWHPAHTLLVGRSGTGKSEMLLSLLMYCHKNPDMALVAADAGSGSTFGQVEDALAYPLAVTPDEILLLSKQLYQECIRREATLRETKSKVYTGPWIVYAIDEYPNVVEECGAEFISIIGKLARKSRKARIILLLAAQNGSKKDIGDKETQSQFGQVIGLGLDSNASRTLWQSAHSKGWSTVGFAPGEFRFMAANDTNPNKFTGYLMGDDVQTLAKTPKSLLEPETLAVLKESQSIDAEMVALLQEPITVAELSELLHIKPNTARNRLKKLVDAGEVDYQSPHYWRVTD